MSRFAQHWSPSRRWALVGVGLALIILFAFRETLGLSGGADQARGTTSAPVIVAVAKIQDMPVYAQTIGTVIANATVQIKSRIDGEIISAPFREGQLVRKGDLLFEIDRAPYEAALRAATANLQRDEAQLANARRDLSRANELAKKGYASTQTRDAASANMRALTASVAAEQAAVDQAQLQLGYTEIRSPIDGKTGPILVDAGNIIKANDANPLVVVTQIQPVKISFALAQQNLPQLQTQMRNKTLVAVLRPHNVDGTTPSPDAEVTAPIDFIDNTVNTASGTIELRATYDNSDLRLVPGEFVDLRVRLDELKAVTVIPRDAVNTGQDGLYVFAVNNDNKVEMRKITLLHEDGDLAAVTGDIDAGERVVTDGQLRLLPGASVKIVEQADEAAQS
jgi:multidrug efflux system membrane fusion protein